MKTAPCPLALLAVLAALAVLSSAGCESLVTDVFEYGRIEASVERRNGDPVPGAEVVLYTGQRPMDVGATGLDGRHVFEFVPFGNYGVASGVPDGYARIEWVKGGPSTSNRDNIRLAEGERAEVEFVLVKVGPGAVEVVATEPGGQAIEGVPVTLFEPAGPVATDTTDASGTVRFEEIPFGNYGVVATRPERFIDLGEDPHLFEQGIVVEEGLTESLDFLLEPCEGTIRARVESTGGGPASDFPLVLYNGEGSISEATTGPDGMHTFGPLLCRDFGLALGRIPGWIVEDGRGTSFVDGVRLTRDHTDRSFTFQVEPCHGLVGVRTFDPDGAPISGAPVRLYASTGALDEGRTEDGAHVFDQAPCGDLGVALVREPGWEFEDVRGESWMDGIAVTAGSEAFFDFTVSRCEGSITAHVMDEAGSPVEGATLTLYNPEGQASIVETPASGVHVFDGVGCATGWGVAVDPPEGYGVETGRGTSWFDGIDIEDGTEETVTFTLQAT